MHVRQGSNELDSSCSRESPVMLSASPVMLSAAKHLSADRDRPFAEFTLSAANGLRVTGCDSSHGQGFFFTIEPCPSRKRCSELYGAERASPSCRYWHQAASSALRISEAY